MTYILGLKQPGINAIIADCRETRLSDGEGQNDVLKIGQLFPGCIFGRAGSVQCSKELVFAFQHTIKGVTDTPEGFWGRFEGFLNSYDFRRGRHDHFKLLLSTRLFHVPSFFVLDSDEGLSARQSEAENCWISGGSGMDALDDYVRDALIPRLGPLIQRLVIDEKRELEEARRFTPYFFCLWLSELSLTHEKTWLENKYGVGGPFYFLYQIHDGEYSQQPAVYIFSVQDPINKSIFSWVHRVASVSGGLYVETKVPPQQNQKYPVGTTEDVFLDFESGFDDPRDNRQIIENEVRQEIGSQNYFYFCGLGFSPPSDRHGYGCFISETGNKDKIYDKDGALGAEIRKLIQSNYSHSSE